MLVADLPDVTARIAEAGRADPPRTIHRPVQQIDTPALQLLDHRVHVVYGERTLELPTPVGVRDRRGGGKPGSFTRLEQVDERVTELEDRRVVVFEVDWEPKDVAVEALRGGQVLDEQRDCGDPSRPHCLSVLVHLRPSPLAMRRPSARSALGSW